MGVVVTIPAVLLFGLLVFAAIRFANLSVVLALVAVLFGLFLAFSSAGPSVHHWLDSIGAYLSGHGGGAKH